MTLKKRGRGTACSIALDVCAFERQYRLGEKWVALCAGLLHGFKYFFSPAHIFVAEISIILKMQILLPLGIGGSEFGSLAAIGLGRSRTPAGTLLRSFAWIISLTLNSVCSTTHLYVRVGPPVVYCFSQSDLQDLSLSSPWT